MNYAITGNKGLIGTFLKERLDKEGHKCVMAIDKREGFDISDLMFKEYKIKDKIDVFFHFAAQCKINEAISNPFLPHKNNVDGILAVLEFCKRNKIPKIIVASTSRVLSKERNPYVASKIYTEELTKAYANCYGLKYIIIRPSTVYGPMFDETSRLINNWLCASFKNEDIRLYGDDEKTLDFTYIDDFVDGVILSMKGEWNKIYNISGDEEVKLIALANYIIQKTKSKSKIKVLPEEKAQPQNVNVDITDIQNKGFKPKVSIIDGIDIMVDFYKKNTSAWKKYIDKGRQFYNG